MALLIETPERQYNKRELQEATLGVTPGAETITITITRGDWPVGPCVEFELLWDGVSDGLTMIEGGPVTDKAGNPIPGGTTQVTRTAAAKGASFTARVRLLERLRGAVRVEDNT